MEIKNSAYIDNGIPWFDNHIGHNYEMWNIRMKTFLHAQGFDVRKLVVIGYTATMKPTKTETKKELKINNRISMDFILEGLPDSVQEKVRKFSSAKELWEKLQNIYSKKSHPITCLEHTDKKKEYVKSE
jgi:hypothetical protein